MTGSWVDVVLVVAAGLFALVGFRQGFVVGALSLLGFLGGGALGAVVAPDLLRRLDVGANEALVGLLVVALGALVGQAIAASVGATLKSALRWEPARLADASAGAALSAAGLLLIAWFVGSLVLVSPFPRVVSAVRSSAVLGAVDGVLPDPARTAFSDLRRSLRDTAFPSVFGGFGRPPTPEVAAPDPALVDSPAVQAAQAAVVRVEGVAASCSRRVEGTGFAYAPGRVITNAHVVAGVDEPRVTTFDGEEQSARVVVFDPGRDIAVLAVDDLGAAPLAFGGDAESGTDAVVVGFPEGGPFTVTPARVRAEQDARGPDIYEESIVTREVYALRAAVRPGNSGGPLLAPDGSVLGVIFAASAEDPSTGYALTADEVAGQAAAGVEATATVDSGRCV